MANLEPMPISSLPEGSIQDGDKMIIYRDSNGKAYQSDASSMESVAELKEEVDKLSADLTDLNSAVIADGILNRYVFDGTLPIIEQLEAIQSTYGNNKWVFGFIQSSDNADADMPTTSGNFQVIAYIMNANYINIQAFLNGGANTIYYRAKNMSWGSWRSISTTAV